MSISLICVGKIKEKFYKEAINEYKKALRNYLREGYKILFEIIIISDLNCITIIMPKYYKELLINIYKRILYRKH